MLKNLPKEYKDLFLRLANQPGFIGFENGVGVSENGYVSGESTAIFDTLENAMSKEVIDLQLDLLDLNFKRTGNEETCFLYLVEINRADKYLNKEDFINALL